jgi:hypothetical protein
MRTRASAASVTSGANLVRYEATLTSTAHNRVMARRPFSSWLYDPSRTERDFEVLAGKHAGFARRASTKKYTNAPNSIATPRSRHRDRDTAIVTITGEEHAEREHSKYPPTAYERVDCQYQRGQEQRGE